MIKSFEEFVSAKYGRPVNEAFQSSKLREIIKQHGKPKYSWENKMLYDLKDDEIVDVLDNRSEYWNKYLDEKTDDGQATFMLELEDGTVVVIGNLNILKRWLDTDGEMKRKKEELFKERHAERHKGNLGKGGDDIHRRHMDNVDKIERKRLAELLQPNIQEIADAVKSIMDNIDPSDINENDEGYIESEITLNGDEYVITANYECGSDEGTKRYGAVYYNVYYYLTSFEICNENTLITNEELGVTEKTHGDLFKEYTDEVEGEIYDYYNYYGVSPSDFY